jgi:hypothetical protein
MADWLKGDIFLIKELPATFNALDCNRLQMSGPPAADDLAFLIFL